MVNGYTSMAANGKKFAGVLIYAFIYQGVPSWDKTDGVVTLHVPEQPPIETRLTEGDNKRTLCAIARLVNENGSIRVERINQYFRGRGGNGPRFWLGVSLVQRFQINAMMRV